MPRKIRDIIEGLQHAGFVNRGGKGSHRNFVHPKVVKPITISGRDGDDAKYVKIIEWSDEDKCFIGSCPELLFGGCHGENEHQVFDELCQVIDETLQIYREDGKPLPHPLSGREFVNAMHRVA